MRQWRPIVGYEEIYEIRPGSDGGAIRRIAPIERSYVGRLLGNSTDCWGYKRANLSKPECAPRLFRMHELILITFIGPKPKGLRGLHKDDVKHNNVLSNLYWGTASQNNFDAVKNKKHWKFTKPNTGFKSWETRREI